MRMRFDPPTDPAAYPCIHPIRVRFAETDAMRVVHHAAYLPYLEEARVELFRQAGFPYGRVRAEGFDLAVVEVAMRYQRPLRFDDVVEVGVRVAEAGLASFQMDYLLRCRDVTVGTAVTVHGVVDAAGRASRAPRWLREALQGGV